MATLQWTREGARAIHERTALQLGDRCAFAPRKPVAQGHQPKRHKAEIAVLDTTPAPGTNGSGHTGILVYWNGLSHLSKSPDRNSLDCRSSPRLDNQKRCRKTMADIIHRIGIKAPVGRVIEAVSTVAGVAGWWTRDTTGTSGPGGSMTARFSDPAGKEIGRAVFDVTKVDPNTAVHWRFTDGPPEWIGTDVTFDLSRQSEYTILVFGHRNWREAIEFTAHCSMKWATFLLSLRALVETGKGLPSPHDIKIDNWN